MKSLYVVGAMVAPWLVLNTASASAAEVEVTWEEPGKYSDMRAADENQSSFEQRIMQQFEEIFVEFASDLPADQRLLITVTNVDLAGAVEQVSRSGSMDMVRIVNQNRYPRMDINFELQDADGNVLHSGEEVLRGRSLPGVGARNTAGRSGDTLYYEKQMIERWFRATFDDA